MRSINCPFAVARYCVKAQGETQLHIISTLPLMEKGKMQVNRERRFSQRRRPDEADKQVGDKKFDLSTLNQEDIAALVEDLEVHRIELELQNQELLKAQSDLSHSHDRLVDLYDNAPLAYFTIDQRTKIITEVNLPGCRLLQMQRKDLLNDKFTRYLDPEFTGSFYLCQKRAIESRQQQVCELKLRLKDGTLHWTELRLTCIEQEQQLRIAAFDISLRKQFELELIRLGELKRKVFDAIPVALMIFDTRLGQLTLNKFAEEFFGWTTEEANEYDFPKQLYSDHPALAETIRAVGAAEPGWRQLYATVRGGSKVPVEWAHKWLDSETMVGIGVDLRQRKESEARIRQLLEERSQNLKQVQTQFQVLIHSMKEGILIIDTNGIVKFANPAASHHLSLSEEQIVGHSFGVPVPEPITEIQIPEKRHRKTLELHTVDIVWDEQEAFLVTVRDITQHKRATRRIRDLSRRLIDAQEKERRQIGRELHDEVGGALTAIKIAIARTAKLPPGDTTKELSTLTKLLDEIVDKIDTVSHNIRPDILDRFGLVEAVKWYLDRYKKQTGIHVRLTHKGVDKRYESTIEVTAYRIILEALTNIARYSGVKLASISIRQTKKALQIQIEDKGRGFNAKEVSINSSGIGGMEDRVALVGGTLTVDSSPKMGTLVTCHIPVELD